MKTTGTLAMVIATSIVLFATTYRLGNEITEVQDGLIRIQDNVEIIKDDVKEIREMLDELVLKIESDEKDNT